MAKVFLNPDTLPGWQAFSQVVITHEPTKVMYISGQVAADRDKGVIGAGDLRAQAL